MAQAELKYEDALKRLEKLVAELDRSELDLEARLKKFEEGTKLARLLAKKLDQAKKRVEVLVKNSMGEPATQPFDTQAAGEADGGDSDSDEDDNAGASA